MITKNIIVTKTEYKKEEVEKQLESLSPDKIIDAIEKTLKQMIEENSISELKLNKTQSDKIEKIQNYLSILYDIASRV